MKINLERFSYFRIIKENISSEEMNALKRDSSYVFVASLNELPYVEGYQIIEKKSAVILISECEEQQLASYSPTCRNEIRRSLLNPNITIEINSTPIDELFNFHSICENERNWKPIPKEELESSITVCIRYEGELLSGITAYGSENLFRIGRIFSRRRSEKYKDVQKVVLSSASRRAIHELIKYSLKKGNSKLDLGGIDIKDPSKKGITQFKLSFGAEVTPVWIGRYYGNSYDNLNNFIQEKGFDLT